MTRRESRARRIRGAARLGLMLCTPALVAASCEDAASLQDRLGPEIGEELDSVSLEVTRTAPARLTSADGQVTVEIPPLAVERTTTLKLSKVLLTGGAPVTIAYRLQPEGRVFLRPVRISFGASALPTPRSPEVRVVQLSGHGSADWQALSRPEATSAEVLGRTRDGGTFAAVDTTEPGVGNVQPFTLTSEADVLLSRGEVEAARAAYAAVINQTPQSVRARLGRAVSTALLIPDAPAVRSVLSRCQLAPLAPASLYQRDGYLDQLARDQAGRGELTLDFGGIPDDSSAEAVISRSSTESVCLRMEDRDHLDGAWTFEISIDLARAGAAYAYGQDLAADEFPGEIMLTGPSGRYQVSSASVGSVHIDAAGRAPGQELGLTFTALRMLGAEGDQVRVSGSVSDVLASAPVPAHALFTTAADPGPPYRAPFAALLGACGASLTSDYLFAQATLLGEELDAIADDLEVVRAAALAYDPDAPGAAEDPQRALAQAIPSFLLRASDDVALNQRDLPLLISTIRAYSALLELLAPYRFFGYDAAGLPVPLSTFLIEQELAYEGAGGVALRAERALSAALIADDLSRNLLRSDLERAALTARLTPLRGTFDALLEEVIDALTQQPITPGLFDLDSVATVAFASSLLEALQALRASLPQGAAPIAAPANPGYSYLASALFSQPPLHADLISAIGETLFLVTAGDPEATSAAERNPSMRPAPGLVERLLEVVLQLPPDAAGLSCRGDAICGADGLLCDLSSASCELGGEACVSTADCAEGDVCLGVCARAVFTPIPEDELERALGGARPALLHEVLWRAFAPLFEALPSPR